MPSSHGKERSTDTSAQDAGKPPKQSGFLKNSFRIIKDDQKAKGNSSGVATAKAAGLMAVMPAAALYSKLTGAEKKEQKKAVAAQSDPSTFKKQLALQKELRAQQQATYGRRSPSLDSVSSVTGAQASSTSRTFQSMGSKKQTETVASTSQSQTKKSKSTSPEL